MLWLSHSAIAEEPAHSIDLGALPSNIRENIRQLEQEQPKRHAGKTPAVIDPTTLKFENTLDSTEATPKWDEPARIETILNGSTEADGASMYAITSFLPFQICVIDKHDSSPKLYSVCKNFKF